MTKKKTKSKTKKSKKSLCKHCGKRERESLYFCKPCLKEHNRKTRELKRRYRKEGKCVMCGKDSGGKRRCEECYAKHREQVKNSPYLNEKKAKQGLKTKEILEVC